METRSITLYNRPECELCVEALKALSQIVAASPTPLVINEVNIEGDPVLHQRLLTEIPAVEYGGHLLSHATSRMRIATFIANIDDAVQRV
ncbi:MAG: glutaredoxin family protein [Chloroflexi bacterium]|nr:MAG: glutaredoxin family protein [Chloroflexota bacterium]